VLTGPLTLHEAQTRGDGLKVALADQFGIEHATLELECHDCADDETRPHETGSHGPGAPGDGTARPSVTL
jgi:hypothetical protein